MKGEFELISGIRKLFPQLPEGVTGIGDDCAVIPQMSGTDTLVSTDMLVEGVHFLREDIHPAQLGWKAAAVNFSDIAAMGGEPVGSFLSIALPKDISQDWIDGFLSGYRDISQRYGFPLLGGDTTSSSSGVCICVTVLGRIVSGGGCLRSAAVPGDLICVTGPLGDSAAGLQAILRGIPREGDVPYLIERHYLPCPRIQEGMRLAANPDVHAMMDVSDGIGSDLRHILEESGVGAEVDVRMVPVSAGTRRFCQANGLDPLDMAISGGEDYELLFTIDPSGERPLDVPHFVIGKITDSPGIVWSGSEKDYTGFRHF